MHLQEHNYPPEVKQSKELPDAQKVMDKNTRNISKDDNMTPQMEHGNIVRLDCEEREIA